MTGQITPTTLKSSACLVSENVFGIVEAYLFEAELGGVCNKVP